ncbi:F-box domain-containing protein [Favolaschia claudopus]|uniref:F-box domain-containing protein n=1 Tax=Favolaschia claudopus TaxID=2862362 RepID=A0AAW0DD67_9AGAR
MFSYEGTPGFFAQDDPQADPSEIGAVPAGFGLLDVSEDRWKTFFSKLRELNAANDGASYKLILFGRHGQGYHNVAEDKYGTEAWDDYWSKLNGDGELTWGPDPELTDLGKTQASAANEVWKAERTAQIPFPRKLYCSPMTRALQTYLVTFDGVIMSNDGGSKTPVILEECREQYGEHTCDKRSTLSHIRTAFPQFAVEEGFSEEDKLWEADVRESPAHVAERAKRVLDRIFSGEDEDAMFISVTAHSGLINGFLRAIGRERYVLPTGGVLPVVVKATRVSV